MGGRRKGIEDLVILAVMALLVWVASRVKGSFRVVVTVVLVAAGIAALTTKPWLVGFAVIGILFMWREKLPRGLYIRRAVSIGPVRVNVSKGGLGGSVGVKGVRIGHRPNGSTYVHAGRGGAYYRRELRKAGDEGEHEDAPDHPAEDKEQ